MCILRLCSISYLESIDIETMHFKMHSILHLENKYYMHSLEMHIICILKYSIISRCIVSIASRDYGYQYYAFLNAQYFKSGEQIICAQSLDAFTMHLEIQHLEMHSLDRIQILWILKLSISNCIVLYIAKINTICIVSR